MTTNDNSPSILSLFQLTDDQHAATTARDIAISVTAGAGSGKTRALVGRYLALLESELPLRSLVAITFTDKAAREMRNRVRAITAEWLAQKEAAPNRALWEEAFSALDSARIGTIHGLCSVILRTHPAEAGLDPAFEVLDEAQSAMWRAQAVEAGLAWATTQPDVAHLFGFFQEGQLRRLLADLLERRLDTEEALATLSGDQSLERWAGALDHWLAEQLAVPLWQESLETLTELQATNEEDKLEMARRTVLAHWDEACRAQANREWDSLFEALLSLRGAISVGGQKGNWAADDLAAAREAMRALRTHFDQVVSRLVSKKKPLSWTLDTQAAELLPLVQRLFEQTRAIYQGYKLNAHALDFDDLEQMTAQLLANNEAVCTRWQQEINAVLLVDEFQDTNRRQREIVYALAGFEPPQAGRSAGWEDGKTEQSSNLPASPPASTQTLRTKPQDKASPSSLFVVGDAKQCFVPGTPILTPVGYKPIEQISCGDEVIAASGRGQTNTFQVEQVHQRHYAGTIITITTTTGLEIQCTPEHALFFRLIPDLDAYYVYLMRHSTKGFRIGITRGYRTGESRVANGLDSRCRQEGGDAIWVLRRCHSRKEAQIYEQLYLAKYGLPGLCFKDKDYQELDQEAIDFVFASIPTHKRAIVLANDLDIDLDVPHYMPTVAKGATALVYFGGKGNRRHGTHRIHFETRDEQTAQKLTNLGVRKAKPTRYYPHRWRIATERANYDDAHDLAALVARQAEALLVENFALTPDKRWGQMPAGQVFPGLQVPILDKGQVIPDEIARIEQQRFEGSVYDLGVSHVRNYIANNIVVHNSIYRFRGADVAVFRQVQADIEAAGGALINFDLTFRAHKSLVDLTNALLAPLMPGEDDATRPYDVPFAPLTAYRQEPRKGMEPPYLEFQLGLGKDKNTGRLAAAVGLAKRLHELHDAGQLVWQDVALLFRASTAFGTYEAALEQAGIPFVTIAGRGFYDRPEVRDLLNVLAAIADPTDDLAIAGLLRSPAIGLSDGALYLLRWDKHSRRRSFWPALRSDAALAALAEDDRSRAEFARQLIAGLHEQVGRVPVTQLLKNFLDKTHYRTVLRLVSGGERLRRNVDKLLADAHRSELVSVSEFLEYLDALADVGARESEAPTEAGGAVQLMTIHKAKGLEFPVVVLADAGYTGGFRSVPFYLDQVLGLVLNLSTGDAQPATFRLAAWHETEQATVEERRLLYVAATRAQEKFIISGNAKSSTAKKSAGQLLFNGWLAQLAEVAGLSETQLPDAEPVTAQAIPLLWQDGAATCTVHPPPPGLQSPVARPWSPASIEQPLIPDLLAPLTVTPSAELDEKLQQRESDPPPRIWRVVPKSEYDVPAWVVGSLTHLALRYWCFPDRACPEPGRGNKFADFLRPFALEAGLTDQTSIDIALERVAKLLARFQAHPLYTQLSTAERYHEVPYSLMLDGQMRSGIIDLLFRSSPDTGWTIAEFKTDRLPAGADLKAYAEDKGYDRQVEDYRQAVAQQMGTTPQVLLVFLNVGQSVRELSL